MNSSFDRHFKNRQYIHYNINPMHMTANMFFLVGLRAFEFFLFLFFCSTLLIVLVYKSVCCSSDSLLNILVGLCACLHSYSRAEIQWRQTRCFVDLINVGWLGCLCNNTQEPYWWPEQMLKKLLVCLVLIFCSDLQLQNPSLANVIYW